MEGNDCYKFSTIKNFLQKTGQPPIRLALDIGCNLGHVTQLMRQYFPSALIFAFEPVPEYYRRACIHLSDDPLIKVLPFAVTSQHIFADDLGREPIEKSTLMILKALPASGPGWQGGSHIGRVDECLPGDRYEPQKDTVTPISLDQLVDGICTLCGIEQIDYVKMDCEGCENGAIGCATERTLQRLRYVSGEYHDLQRFSAVMRSRLLCTHRVNVIGTGWGSFFAERADREPGILSNHRTHFEIPCEDGLTHTIESHSFQEKYVISTERWSHNL
jgi:FkbM family methyltransferase